MTASSLFFYTIQVLGISVARGSSPGFFGTDCTVAGLRYGMDCAMAWIALWHQLHYGMNCTLT